MRATFGAMSALLLPDATGGWSTPTVSAERGFELRILTESMNYAAGPPGDGPEGRLLEAGPGELLAAAAGPGGTGGRAGRATAPAAFATPEDRRLLEAFADQAALALQRSLSEHRSATAAVDAGPSACATRCCPASRTTSARR